MIRPSSTDEEAKNRAKRELGKQLTGISLTLRAINEILKVQFGSPGWGNLPHVIDELVFILRVHSHDQPALYGPHQWCEL